MSSKIWAKFEHLLNYRALKIFEFSNFERGIPTFLCIRLKFRRTSRLNFVKKLGGSNLKTSATPGRTKISRWRKLDESAECSKLCRSILFPSGVDSTSLIFLLLSEGQKYRIDICISV